MARPPSATRTWGFRRMESLAALAQGLLLLGISIYGIVEGSKRWNDPPEISAREMLIFAAIGLVLNIAAMVVLNSRKNANLNMRGAFLEVMMDALGTVAVILSAILMLTTGYLRADTIAAFVIAAMIIPRAGLLLRDVMHILLEFTPKGLNLDEVRAHIMALEHVQDVHDLHASTVTTGLPVLTAHVVVDDECFTDGHAPQMLEHIQTCVREHFPVSVEHSTFQLETHRLSEVDGHHACHV
jgi:cobalt-zinc-cadmium efflux system protein